MSICKTIAIANQKGGVGKTATTISLGIGLAKQGKRVLLCDLDPQGNTSISLGFDDLDEQPVTMAELLQLSIEGKALTNKSEYLHTVEGVDLIPCDIRLAGVENGLINAKLGRENKLKTILTEMKNDYDFILIDCPPSLSLLPINALVSADSVLIPVQKQYDLNGN